MFRHLLVAALAVCIVFVAPQARAADKPEGIIATIMDVEGAATVTPAGQGNAKPLALKDSIHMHDVITTGSKSRVVVLFIDNTQITLSADTKLTVNEYVFDPDNNTNNKATYDVLSGTFQYVSGLVAKKPKPDVNIETAYGTVGIRGTKFWAGNLKQGYGVHVDEGRVNVRNDGGEVFVDKGLGTSIQSRRTPPVKAAPFTPDQMQFIAQTIFLANAAQVLERIAGFQGQQRLLQGQFKNFLKFNGKGMIPGGGNLPIPGKKNPFGGFPGAPSIPGLPGGF